MGGKLTIIQNVKGEKLERALTVAEKWEKDRVNKGYYTETNDKTPERVSYTVYTESGKKKTFSKSNKTKVNIIEYDATHNAALLAF